MSFLPATYEAGSWWWGEQALPAPPELAAYAGRPVLVGVRAENIDVASGGDGAVRAIVEVVEPTGAAVLLTVRLDGHLLKVQAPADFRAEPDQEVWLRCPLDALRFYDPKTALALSLADSSGLRANPAQCRVGDAALSGFPVLPFPLGQHLIRPAQPWALVRAAPVAPTVPGVRRHDLGGPPPRPIGRPQPTHGGTRSRGTTGSRCVRSCSGSGRVGSPHRSWPSWLARRAASADTHAPARRGTRSRHRGHHRDRGQVAAFVAAKATTSCFYLHYDGEARRADMAGRLMCGLAAPARESVLVTQKCPARRISVAGGAVAGSVSD